MPDNDPLESLDNFSQGLHVNALPASEVRRRGDRMRRRNTALATVGGVVAAAVFIGTPVALMSGNDDDVVQPAPPAPTQTDDPSDGESEWLTEIPAEFPFADGFPETNGLDGSPTQVVDDPPYDGIGACQTGVIPSGQVDGAGIVYTGESEDHSSRTLVLLEDDTAAAGFLDEVRELIQDCPTAPMDNGEDILESSLVDLDLGTESSVVVAQQVRADDGSLSQLTVTEFAQAGNAVLVEQSYGAAGGPQAVRMETERLRERAAVPLGAMCVFSANPCKISEASETPSGVNPIPEGFPLAEGLDDTGDSTVVGPGPDVEAGRVFGVCGTDIWAPDGVLDRLAVQETGPEYLEARELDTFVTADEPAEALTMVRDAVRDCARIEGEFYGYTVTMLEGPPGYDSVTWGVFADEGLDGGVYQITRVGSAVLVLYSAGEMSESSLQAVADDMTPVTLDLASEMCAFTEDGC